MVCPVVKITNLLDVSYKKCAYKSFADRPENL